MAKKNDVQAWSGFLGHYSYSLCYSLIFNILFVKGVYDEHC
jgi:hypothetical protein